MTTINAGNIARGMYLIFKGTPQQVTKAEYMSPGKGSPVMRVKFRSLQSGSASEFTYKSAESVEVADVEKKDLNFLYMEGKTVIFMDPNTFDQVSVPVSLLEDQIGYLIPELKCQVMWYKEKAVGINLPPHVTLKVIEAPEAVAGNRVNSPKKLIKLETGLEIQAPIFIKPNDKIMVDTVTGEYLSRVS